MAKPTEESKVGITKLLERIRQLEDSQAKMGLALDEKDKKLIALEAAQAHTETGVIALMGRHVQEQPLGKRKVTVRVYDHKASKKSGQAEFREEEQVLEFFRYLVDLPAIGGEGVHLGPHMFYHGQTYEIDLNTLRSLKEVVARSWFHEAQIKGDDENKFRQKQNVVIGPRSAIRRSA